MTTTDPSTMLIQSLLAQPQAFGHPVHDVQLLETHISWVVLAGEHAYKIKKPLTLPFLDFGTLALRQAACAEELRINRRSAPDLYLELVPITGTPEAPRVGGDATQAIEWAVHMRRFPAGSLLTDLQAQGALTAQHIDALAHTIAQLQAVAERATPDSPWGQPDQLIELARANFGPLAAAVQHDSALSAELAQLQEWTEREAQRLRPLMQARLAAGHVREGHGDLHLGNLLWLDGRAVLFDAIEFDPKLRWLDGACDLAFLFMDLHAHQQAALAWRLLNAWLERTGDFEAVQRLSWDAVYRAMVRAMVATFHIAPGPVDPADPARAEVARYLRLAAQLATPRSPWLALTVGVSGSGKSSQTQPLIEQHALVRLRADVERKRLFGLGAQDSSAQVPEGIYSEATSDRVFAQLLAQARALLQAGQPVLVDATFITRARRAPFIALAQELGLPWRMLAFDAPPELLRQRVRQRLASGGDASEADEAVLSSQLAQREPLTPAEAQHTLHIDTRQAVDWQAWNPLLPTSY